MDRNFLQHYRSIQTVGQASHRARHNNGMHSTADTRVVIISNGAGRRVMPGVRGVSWEGEQGR
jgi:hypothetical protein